MEKIKAVTDRSEWDEGQSGGEVSRKTNEMG